MSDLEALRRAYADLVCQTGKCSDARVHDAFAAVAREDFLGPGRDRARPRAAGGNGVLSDAGAGVVRVDHPDFIRVHREPDVRIRPSPGGNSLRTTPRGEQAARLEELEHRHMVPPSPRALPPSPSSRIRDCLGPESLPLWDVNRHGRSALSLP